MIIWRGKQGVFAGNITTLERKIGKGIKLPTHTHSGLQSGNSDTQGPK
ncbi:hypothetical protein [Pantoea agglomerans]